MEGEASFSRYYDRLFSSVRVLSSSSSSSPPPPSSNVPLSLSLSLSRNSSAKEEPLEEHDPDGTVVN